jgi:hypothetical protein
VLLIVMIACLDVFRVIEARQENQVKKENQGQQ